MTFEERIAEAIESARQKATKGHQYGGSFIKVDEAAAAVVGVVRRGGSLADDPAAVKRATDKANHTEVMKLVAECLGDDPAVYDEWMALFVPAVLRAAEERDTDAQTN